MFLASKTSKPQQQNVFNITKPSVQRVILDEDELIDTERTMQQIKLTIPKDQDKKQTPKGYQIDMSLQAVQKFNSLRSKMRPN